MIMPKDKEAFLKMFNLIGKYNFFWKVSFKNLKMKRIYIYILLFFLSENCLAENITIKGQVLNDSLNTPVVYANIAIKGYPVGISTNEKGEFSFHIPTIHKNDTLIVSAIGYQSYECVVNKILLSDTLVISLKEQVYKLNDVTIIPDNELSRIIKNVTKRLRKNYPRRKYMLNGFYRELVLKDDRYTRLIEAAIDIHKSGFNSGVVEKVRVNELRKSNSNVEYDWKSKLFTMINGETNYLYTIFKSDVIQYHDKSFITKNILTHKFLDSYDFILEDISIIDSVRIFKIKFFDKKYYDEYEGNFSAIENHWMYIREDNYAIIKYEQKHQIVKNKEKYKTLNFEDDCMFSTTVYYKEYKNKYYPYLYERMRFIVAKYADETTGEGKQYIKSILLINNIITKRRDYERIKFSSPKDIDLYKQKYKYNPAFWANYNILQINPLYIQAKNDLEDGQSLEEQFIKNGK